MERNSSVLASLRQICDSCIRGDYDIDVIDLIARPELARQHQVMAVPLVVRNFPLPEKRVVGDLSCKDLVVVGLGLPSKNTGES
jgi:circadian clock protein KaiB